MCVSVNFFGGLGKILSSAEQQRSEAHPQLAAQCYYSNNRVTPAGRQAVWKGILPSVQKERGLEKWAGSKKGNQFKKTNSMEKVEFSYIISFIVWMRLCVSRWKRDLYGCVVVVLIDFFSISHCAIYSAEAAGINGSKQCGVGKSTCHTWWLKAVETSVFDWHCRCRTFSFIYTERRCQPGHLLYHRKP